MEHSREQTTALREIMSSNLVSTISASPSAAAATARHRHDGVKQLGLKAVQPQQQLHGGFQGSNGRGRAVVARAGPGPLTEIEPDLHEDPIDRWRTNGISPVRSLSLSSLVSEPAKKKKNSV